PSLFFILAVLNVIIYFATMLIGAEGTQTPAGVRYRGDPAGAKAPRRLPGPPANRSCLERKSTSQINTAFILELKNLCKKN
ncbi:hypothetical protein V7266_19465, partial [Neobacillus drentensis]|uniref:hypothetical protein n=1 Tax=Neobacillus drentensis TaxID=220684 RepID=UPI002FFE5ACB